MDRLKLRVYDGIAITGFLMIPALFSTELSRLTEQNNTATWFAVLIAFLIMLCLFLITVPLMARYAGKNIIEITSEVMGSPFGIMYGIVLVSYFCFFAGIHIKESTEILKIYSLSLTPIWIISGLILLAAVIMNFFGGQAIVKSAGFFFIIIVLGIVFIILLGVNRYNPDNLVPIFGNGILDIVKNSLFMASLFDSVIILFLFAPFFSNTSEIKKSGMLSLAITATAYILLSICFIMMFSQAVGAKFISGIIEMGKSSYFNHFFYRFESFLLFFLIFSSVIQASICLFIARKSFVYTFKFKLAKSATVICSILVLTVIFLPINILDLTQRYLPLIRQYSVFFMVGFPLLVFIISIIKRFFKYEKV